MVGWLLDWFEGLLRTTSLPQVVGLLLSRGAMTMYKNAYGNPPLKVGSHGPGTAGGKQRESVGRGQREWGTVQGAADRGRRVGGHDG